jgi:serine protease Do
VNLKGEVIGINDAIDPRAQGIGFAIPINFVKKVLPQLETRGEVSRGYIGAVVTPLTPEIADKIGEAKDLHAPVVTQVMPGSPAEKAGVKPYDAITEVDGTPVHSPSELVMAITSAPVGKSIPLKISRSGKIQTLSIKTKAKPSSKMTASRDSDRESDSTGLNSAGLAVASNSGNGVVVTDVEPDSPADQAGINEGDVILEVNRKPVQDPQSLEKLMKDSDKSYLLRVEKTGPAGNKLYAVTVLDLKAAKEG